MVLNRYPNVIAPQPLQTNSNKEFFLKDTCCCKTVIDGSKTSNDGQQTASYVPLRRVPRVDVLKCHAQQSMKTLECHASTSRDSAPAEDERDEFADEGDADAPHPLAPIGLEDTVDTRMLQWFHGICEGHSTGLEDDQFSHEQLEKDAEMAAQGNLQIDLDGRCSNGKYLHAQEHGSAIPARSRARIQRLLDHDITAASNMYFAIILLQFSLVDRFVEAGGDLRAEHHSQPIWPYKTSALCVAARQPSPLALLKLLQVHGDQGAWDLDTMRRSAEWGSRFEDIPQAKHTLLKRLGAWVAKIFQLVARVLGFPVSFTPLMCAVHSGRHHSVLLFLLMREHDLVRFDINAVNSNGRTAAQMSTQRRTADILLLIHALDLAGISDPDTRAALAREARGKCGFSKQMMLEIIMNSSTPMAAGFGLLEAAQNTLLMKDAQAAVSELLTTVLDVIAPEPEAVEALVFLTQEELSVCKEVRKARSLTLG